MLNTVKYPCVKAIAQFNKDKLHQTSKRNEWKTILWNISFFSLESIFLKAWNPKLCSSLHCFVPLIFYIKVVVVGISLSNGYHLFLSSSAAVSSVSYALDCFCFSCYYFPIHIKNCLRYNIRRIRINKCNKRWDLQRLCGYLGSLFCFIKQVHKNFGCLGALPFVLSSTLIKQILYIMAFL